MVVRIGLASEEEIADVRRPVATDRAVKDLVDGWRIVSIRILLDAPEEGDDEEDATVSLPVFLVGTARSRGRLIATSNLVAVDFDRNLAQTLSGSLYELGDPDPTPPSPELAMALARQVLMG